MGQTAIPRPVAPRIQGGRQGSLTAESPRSSLNRFLHTDRDLTGSCARLARPRATARLRIPSASSQLSPISSARPDSLVSRSSRMTQASNNAVKRLRSSARGIRIWWTPCPAHCTQDNSTCFPRRAPLASGPPPHPSAPLPPPRTKAPVAPESSRTISDLQPSPPL